MSNQNPASQVSQWFQDNTRMYNQPLGSVTNKGFSPKDRQALKQSRERENTDKLRQLSESFK